MNITLKECADDLYALLIEIDVILNAENAPEILYVVTPGSEVFLDVDRTEAFSKPTGTRFFNRRFDRLRAFFSKEFPSNHEHLPGSATYTMAELTSRIHEIVPFAVVSTDFTTTALAIRQCYLSGDRGIEPLLIADHVVWMLGHRM